MRSTLTQVRWCGRCGSRAPASGDVLLLAAHHLTVDVVSWHIMLGDVTEAARAMTSGDAPKMLPEFTSYRRWSELMWQRAAAPQVADQRGLLGRAGPPARSRVGSAGAGPRPGYLVHAARHASGHPGRNHRGDAVLAHQARGRARIPAGRHDDDHRELAPCREQDPAAGALIALEGHGRADAVLDADTTNTVGSFITSYPVRLGAGAAVGRRRHGRAGSAGGPRTARSVVTQLGAVPNDGLDYGLLRYVNDAPELRDAFDPQIQFSYVGRLDLSGATDQPWSLLTEPYIDALPIDPEPDLPLRFALHISALVGTTEEARSWSPTFGGVMPCSRRPTSTD